MDDEWYEALITASLWGPPSLFGVKALIDRPFRIGRRVVSRRMSLFAASAWLAPLPLTLAMTVGLIYTRHPRMEEAARIGREYTPFALRLMSFLCLIAGGIIAFAGSRPEELPKVKKARKKRKSRNR